MQTLSQSLCGYCRTCRDPSLQRHYLVLVLHLTTDRHLLTSPSDSLLESDCCRLGKDFLRVSVRAAISFVNRPSLSFQAVMWPGESEVTTLSVALSLQCGPSPRAPTATVSGCYNGTFLCRCAVNLGETVIVLSRSVRIFASFPVGGGEIRFCSRLIPFAV